MSAFLCGVWTFGIAVPCIVLLMKWAAPMSKPDSSWILADKPAWFGAGGIPMYYINLDRSVLRRFYMEKQFGAAGRLTRIRAIDGHTSGELAKWLPLPANATMFDALFPAKWEVDYANSVLSTVGELALTVGHWIAVRTAFNDGAEVALIMEDDVSLSLVPYWDMTLEEVAKKAQVSYPEWCVIRLQYSVRAWQIHQTIDAMAAGKDSVFSDGRDRWGTAAYLIHRRGMKVLLEELTGDDSTFDCKHLSVKCASDFLMPSFFGSTQFLQVNHPMFAVSFLEEAAGVRGQRRRNPWRRLKSLTGYHEGHAVPLIRIAAEEFEEAVQDGLNRELNKRSARNDSYVKTMTPPVWPSRRQKSAWRLLTPKQLAHPKPDDFAAPKSDEFAAS